ncbi:unnamed protein product [Amoebophrya sp. A120]|nr:unnamed protein product [Amoebophrya sp. A120]|eukprot:GSA120T00007939001.1
MPRVQCYVYDISQGMARMMSMPLLGKQVDIIPHTGIVCFGKEYFFGGGVCVTAAGQAIPMRPCEVLEFGEATKTEAELNAFLAEISPRFTQQTYNLLKHNCNHFANEVSKFLCGTPVPDRIVNVADEALSTPQGQQLRGLIEGFETQMRQNNAANTFNPFGNTSSSVPTPGVVPGTAPATSSTASVSFDDFDRALSEVSSLSDAEQKRACFSTLNKMCSNIVDKPSEEKFRKIKMENPAFNKKVAECLGGTECILAMGFAPEEIEGVDYWVYDPSRLPIDALRICCSKLSAAESKLPAAPRPQQLPGAAGNTAGGFGGAAAPMSATGGMTNPLLNNLGGGMPGMGTPGGGAPPGGMGNIPPGMAQQAQQMMASNPQMAAQAQALMNNPQAMQQMMNDPQIQALMNNPQAMQNMMNMMGNNGGPGR